jgi:hypothetical protein
MAFYAELFQLHRFGQKRLNLNLSRPLAGLRVDGFISSAPYDFRSLISWHDQILIVAATVNDALKAVKDQSISISFDAGERPPSDPVVSK